MQRKAIFSLMQMEALLNLVQCDEVVLRVMQRKTLLNLIQMEAVFSLVKYVGDSA